MNDRTINLIAVIALCWGSALAYFFSRWIGITRKRDRRMTKEEDHD